MKMLFAGGGQFFGRCLSAAVLILIAAVTLQAQELLAPDHYKAVREASSGELPFADFKRIVQFSGYSPAAGADQVANYLASEAKAIGLSNVAIERFQSDGKSFMWAFRTEPYWEAKKAQLWLVKPERELLADFKVYHSYLGRYSRTSSVTAEVVDVGMGTDPKDYEGRSVEGKIVLTNGPAARVMRLAVWERKAAGVIFYRTADAIEHPDLIGTVQLVPWTGPNGEVPTFAFSVSYRTGHELKQRLTTGEKLTAFADVEVDTGPGEYPEVRAEISGTDPSLPVILVYAHDNSRNTGGANNLTGVGCTLEVARLLNNLITTGVLPRPRRTIRFMWGSEHYGITYHFHNSPDDLKNILAMVNIDMIGYNQQTARAVFHLYRSPASNPSFLDDVVQSFVDKVGAENSIAIRNSGFLSSRPTEGFLDPIFAPTGSTEQFHYTIESFWGPSDHEDAQTLGINAILLNDFPDVFLGTQNDTPDIAGDPTQMRRGVVIAASSAYFLASAQPVDIPKLLHNAVTKAEMRLAAGESKAFAYLDAATKENLPRAYRDAANVIRESYSIEVAALQSLSRLVGDSVNAPLQPYLVSLEAQQQALLKQAGSYAQSRASQIGVSADALKIAPADAKYINAFPQRDPSLQGPLNTYRPEYGRWWLVEKTGDEHFDKDLPLTRRGDYVAYEALNLANGHRSITEIRDIVSAEFDPVPVEEVAQYFEFLQKLGAVQIKTKGGS